MWLSIDCNINIVFAVKRKVNLSLNRENVVAASAASSDKIKIFNQKQEKGREDEIYNGQQAVHIDSMVPAGKRRAYRYRLLLFTRKHQMYYPILRLSR